MKNETLKIRYQSVSSLTPAPTNPRTHPKRQIEQIAKAIEQFGFTNPILVTEDNQIIAGHGRVEAAKLNGIERIPTICIEDLTEAEIRALIIADNRLAQNAGWDENLLRIEFEYLTQLDFDIDLSAIGFETAEIDLLLAPPTKNVENAVDDLNAIDLTGPQVSKPGDLWQLGSHRLYCGDATEPESFERLMGEDRAELVFVDPPFNVKIDGHVCGLGAVKHREFAMAAGEMSKPEFTEFLEIVLRNLADHSVDGSIHYVCMDWRHMGELLAAGEGVYTELKNLCVWNKDNGGMGSLYRSKHELVFVFKHGTAPHTNNVELGRHGRYRTNVWDYPGVNSLRADRLEELKLHPTVKPVELVADAIRDCSNGNGIVLDCFGGSGTTLLAADESGRRGYLMELDPAYVDVTIRRYEALAGREAVLTGSDQTFEAVAQARLTASEETKEGTDNE